MNVSDLLVRDLMAVVAVSHHGHFGRAAAALHIAQPTLSAQVRKVERALGATIFERTGRSFLVTPEGREILTQIREVLERVELLATHSKSGRRMPGGSAPPLRLGIIPTLGPYLVPHLLVPMKSERPSISLELSERTTAALLDGLIHGELDAAILSLPLRHQSVESLPLFDEPFRLIAPRDHELLAADRLTPARLRADEMVLLEEGHCLREQTIAVCSRRGGAQPRVVTTSLETLKYLVASGAGYSLLPELASEVPSGLEQLVGIRKFDDRPPSRRIVLSCRRTMTRHADVLALAEFVRGHNPLHVRVSPGSGATQESKSRDSRSPSRR